MKNPKQRLLAGMLAFVLLVWPVLACARYATLEFGSYGTAVLKLQKALLSLGYYSGSTDGKFGRATEEAVKAYQIANGLEADGKAGHLTQSRLYDGISAPASGNTVSTGNAEVIASTPPSSSTGSSGGKATNPNTLKLGDNDSRVAAMQTQLKKLGYYSGAVDGNFGKGTERAVIAFQKSCRLTMDGLAGEKTLRLLADKAGMANASGTENVIESTVPAATGSGSGFVRTLRKGYLGEDVKAVQRRLKELGYEPGNVDGQYGAGSMAAVRAFQRDNGLTVDGLTGLLTWTRLMASGAASANTLIANAPTTNTPAAGTPIVPVTGSQSTVSSGADRLKQGDNNESVLKLQKALQTLGYNVSADGSYGPETAGMVAAFQRLNGLAADGVADAKMQAVLYGGNAVRYTQAGTASNAGGTAMGTASGPSGSSVKLLHWFNEVKPSLSTGNTLVVYDPATGLQWNLRVYSRGNHCDSEPQTAEDTAAMQRAFGGVETWTPKPVYVKLPSGVWTLASTHDVPHDSSSIKDNNFNGHLCVHFLRDMDECTQHDPKYGVTNQNAIRKKWKELTGITVN